MMNGKSSDHHIDPLEMEPTLNGKAHDETDQQGQSFDPCGTLQTLGMLVWVYASYYKRFTVPIAALLVIVVVIWSLESIANAATDRYRAPKIDHDYTGFASEIDFQLAQVDHWCLHGGDDDCRCDDPTLGYPAEDRKGWVKAHHLNKKLLSAASLGLDLVVVGDAAVEEWNARHLGQEKTEFKAVNKYWKKTFTKAGGGELEGVALGIAGDLISNLRWRLRHGEGLKSLSPDVWWILIGMNDLGFGQCSEEVVLLGILKLAEEIHLAKPTATIVINSILPRKALLKRKKKHDVDLNSYIHAVNAQLQKFCAKHDHIEYVDTTAMFLTGSSTLKDKHPAFKTEMFQDDGIHLSKQGHEAWGAIIKKRVKPIVDANKAAYADQFTDDAYNLYGDDDVYQYDDGYSYVDDDWDYGGADSQEEEDDIVSDYDDYYMNDDFERQRGQYL